MIERVMAVFALAIVLAGVTPNASAAPDPTATPDWLGAPFWKSKTMVNEPLLFIQETAGAPATAKLLFAPDKNLTITDPSQTVTYTPGVDYIWSRGNNIITLTENSKIPFKTLTEMYPAFQSNRPHTMDGKGILWSEGNFFHGLQVQATYEHRDKWTGEVPKSDTQRLERSIAKLKTKQPFKLVVLGDSISEGYNASGFAKTEAPPMQPSYPGLVADGLTRQFGAPVDLVNFGVAGTTSAWGETVTDKVVAEKPDLTIIAFGMNDGEPSPEFKTHIANIVSAVRAGCPDSDIILVAGILPNPEMRSPDLLLTHRDALFSLEDNGIAVADVTSFWADLLKRKSFHDISGNNNNHPNDFGHRVYAQVILQLFKK